MIGEIFITRVFIVCLIIYIFSTNGIEELVKYYNKRINSKNKEAIKEAKKQKKLIILSLLIFSIISTFVFANVTHKYFYSTPVSELGSFDKSPRLDKVAKQFYRMIETGRFIREVD